MLVKDACARAKISRDTLHGWIRDDSDFSDAYARAREDQAHALAEEAIDIADGVSGDAQDRIEALASAIDGLDEDYKKEQILSALAHAAVQRDKVRVDARKWLVAKIAPRIYSERIQQEHSVDEGLAALMRQAEERVASGR